MLDILLGFISTAILAIVGWIFHTNSKVNVTDQKYEDLKELIKALFTGLDKRLERMERSLNGSLYRE